MGAVVGLKVGPVYVKVAVPIDVLVNKFTGKDQHYKHTVILSVVSCRGAVIFALVVSVRLWMVVY